MMELNYIDNVTKDVGHFPLRRITTIFYMFILASLLQPLHLQEYLFGSRLTTVMTDWNFNRSYCGYVHGEIYGSESH
jgi:hypothetical protein